jgi:hypothetical protein
MLGRSANDECRMPAEQSETASRGLLRTVERNEERELRMAAMGFMEDFG